MWRLGPRKLPLGIQIRGGSNWILLNKEFVSYVVNGDDELINGLRTLYSYTLVPAESFFHTTLRNSKFCLSLHKNNLRVENWKKQLGCKSRYASVMDWKICSPNGKFTMNVPSCFIPRTRMQIQNMKTVLCHF